MTIFGKRLRELREKKNLSQEALGKLFHLSQSMIAHYEAGRKQPSQQTLRQMADFFGVSIDYLLGRTNDPRPVDKIIEDIDGWPRGPTVSIPILGVIRAGEPIYADENIIDWVEVPAEEVKNGEYFYLRVKGDSMIGSRIYPGDIVLVRRQETVDNGQIAVVLVNDEEATLKRVKFLEEAVILYPDNPKYQPQIYRIDEVRILGRVIKVEFEP
ncbi:helix-turn-helix domain-containing protein [Desulfofundulus sp. TPOSR]|uniref:LexA family protein n=1 Tax=Desulfofundulus sp. TPOSR TaxID=2714340 RepID=UPI001402B414|nr:MULTISPECIES: LexA family transcriptional regulator [Desulfofundulus]NHM28897.1 helix-turn-helix domain-containing protein [Desulfofundulus sp. TPOSR]